MVIKEKGKKFVQPPSGRNRKIFNKGDAINLTHQAVTKDVTHRFGPVVNTQLCVDVLDMIPGGDVTDMQRVRQGLGVETLGEQFQNLPFTAS